MIYKVVFENGIVIDNIKLPNNNQFPIGRKAWKAALNSIEYDKTKVLHGEVYEITDGNRIKGSRSLGKFKTRKQLKHPS